MQFNFITIAINAAKHPAINSLSHGLRLIIRLMEIPGPQRESSILSGQEATNQWLGNGGLSKYQVSSGLDHLEKILIDGKPLIKMSMRFIPGTGKTREIDISGLALLDMEYKKFFSLYCQDETETAQQKRAKGNKKSADSLVKPTLVKPSLVKPALVKPARHISINSTTKVVESTALENQDFQEALKVENEIIDSPTQRDVTHPIFDRSKWLGDKMAVSQTIDGGCHKIDKNRPSAMTSARSLPFRIFKEASPIATITNERHEIVRDMLDEIGRYKEDIHRFYSPERKVFYRAIRALVFERERDLSFHYIDKAFMMKKKHLLERLEVDMYFIDKEGMSDDDLAYLSIVYEKDKMVLCLEADEPNASAL